MNISQVILKPVLTEKSVRGASTNKYTFIVHREATKVDVKIAIKELYGVNAEKVNVLRRLPKYRWGRRRKPMQKRDETRKAIITLKKGEKLDLSKLHTKSSKEKKAIKTKKETKSAKTTK